MFASWIKSLLSRLPLKILWLSVLTAKHQTDDDRFSSSAMVSMAIGSGVHLSSAALLVGHNSTRPLSPPETKKVLSSENSTTLTSVSSPCWPARSL